MNCVLLAKMDQVFSKENKTLKKNTGKLEKNTGKVRKKSGNCAGLELEHRIPMWLYCV